MAHLGVVMTLELPKHKGRTLTRPDGDMFYRADLQVRLELLSFMILNKPRSQFVDHG
jgi:hypothetical protein